MFTRKLRTACALLLPFFLLATFSVASAATVTIINLDVAGTGLNDTTPATPVGGNTGITKGAQALTVFHEAASIWGGILGSPVEIKVGSSFAALSCSATSGVLGSAGPQTAHRDFANAPLASTWYPQALANSLVGTDLDAATNDIGMQFNGSMGTPGCLESLSWYMGLDAVEPANTISLLSVALHEIGHGLGFASFVTLSTGALFNSLPDGYSSNLEDHSTGLLYPAMSNAQRVSASTNTGNLHWTGALVVAASGVLTSGAHASGHVEMYAPNPAQQGSSVSHFSTSLTPNELMEPSHTGPDLDPGLAVPLLQDMGWALATGCGDGVLDVGEECDDGNTLGGDCCSSSCTFETDGSACTDDGDTCTTDTCDGAGTCDHPAAADGSACDDGVACTTGETCQAGTCLSSTPACDDNESCTVDTCEVSDCFSTGHGAGCNDPVCESTVCALDSYCCTNTWDNLCVNGSENFSPGSVNLCAGRENFCGNAGSPDGTLCDDGDPATGGDVCTGGVCAGTGDLCAGVTCSASDQCHDVGTCDPGTGLCSDPALANGTACDDSDACTQTDTCQAGTCTGSNPVVCSATDQCHTTGTCDSGTGVCSNPNAADGTSCNDGLFCNAGETCSSGVCDGGAATDCSGSADQCNTGACNETSNACEAVVANEGNACDDGDLATTGDQCSAGVCSGTIPPPPAVVSISLPAGDPVPGQIITGELLIETSVPLGNYGIDINCDAALLTIVPPVSGGNTTEFTAAPVQNLGACSATLSGFQFSSLTSPTGVVSVAHVQFEVLAGAVAGSSSTVDLVPSVIGDPDGNSLAFVALDNTITIASVCGNGLLEVGEQCDDSNTDAGDCCSATCTFEPGSCDDGAFCTTGETCTAGVCGGGGLTDCSGAGDQCNSGSCNESSNACEAVVANEGNACDDGAFCTTGETCTAGACGGGGLTNCSGAGDQCNSGSCNESSNACESVAANEGASCDDGNVATTSDVCTAGTCSGTNLCSGVTCTASDQCHTVGTCDPNTGLCSNPAAAAGSPCGDSGTECVVQDTCDGSGACTDNGNETDGTTCGSASDSECSNADSCLAGACDVNDEALGFACGDAGDTECTNPDTCNGSGTCQANDINEGGSCADALFCNGAELCQLGACVNGAAPDCGDGVGCTTDSCNEGTDTCDNTPVDAACDNGQFCDGTETCSAALDCQSGSDPCPGQSCDESGDQCLAGPVAMMEAGTVSVGGSPVTVLLENLYSSPVVACTVQYDNNTTPVVTRVSAVGSSSFQVRLQNPSGGAVATDNVNCLVVEEGTWTIDGVNIEAQTYLSTVTDRKSSWVGEAQSYGQSYTSPVVIGQVMTENDADWSYFWARGGSRQTPPTSGSLFTGKGVAEDSLTIRADETVGFIVIEAGHGTIAGVEFETGLGTDTVRGVDNGPPFAYNYSTAFATAPLVAVASQAAVDGNDGGWVQTFGAALSSASQLFLSIDEDQISNGERSHTTEQVGYAVFAEPVVYPLAPSCTEGQSCDDSDACTTGDTCTGGVCAGSATDCSGFGDQCNTGVCNAGTGACETQPANEGVSCDDGAFCNEGETCAAGSCSGGSATDCSGSGDQCNTGTCNETTNACQTVTSNEGGSCDDGAFCNEGETCTAGSCGGGGATDCSGATDQCNTGTCNEGTDACETVASNEGAGCDDGDLCSTGETCTAGSCSGGSATDCSGLDDQCNTGVCNAGSGLCESQPANEGVSCDDGAFCNEGETCAAGSCAGGGATDCGDGVGCTTDSCNESTNSCSNTPVDAACVNGQFCDGTETCSATLDCQSGADPCPGQGCNEATDQCLAGPVAMMEAGTVAVGGSPVTVVLVNSYTSPVVACTVQYDNNTTPVVTRVSAVGSSSFQVRLQNPSGGAVATDNVNCLVVEEGTWTIDGVNIEAQTYLSTVTDRRGNWNGQSQSYGQAYTSPVVIGQVMTENDANWSHFWSNGGSRQTPPSAATLNTGKAVGEDGVTSRADETVGFIVIEAGHGTIGGVEFEAALGADTVRGIGNNPPYSYSYSTEFAASPTVAVMSQAAMDGNDGAWAQAHGATLSSSTTLFLSVDEDQVGGNERRHATEQVSYAVFAGPVVYP